VAFRSSRPERRVGYGGRVLAVEAELSDHAPLLAEL
jgi:hypothetical protein